MGSRQPSMYILTPRDHPTDADVRSVVDIRRGQQITAEKAAVLRSSPDAKVKLAYYLLITRNRGFLWKDPPGADEYPLPTIEFTMDSILARYPKTTPKHTQHKYDMTIVLMRWFNDLRTSVGAYEATAETERSLAETGFIHALHDAQLRSPLVRFSVVSQPIIVLIALLTLLLQFHFYSSEYVILFLLDSIVFGLLILFAMNGQTLRFGIPGLGAGIITTIFIVTHYSYFWDGPLSLSHKLPILQVPIGLTLVFLPMVLREMIYFFQENRQSP